MNACRCTPPQIDRYANRLSGPLRDRIDLTVAVAAMPARELTEAAGGEASAAIRDRVVAARDRQFARGGMLNARRHGRALRHDVQLDADARRLLDTALTKLSLSARAHDRVLRVARTIADLAGSAGGDGRASGRGAAVSGVTPRQSRVPLVRSRLRASWA